jgi:hypothetical protein
MGGLAKKKGSGFTFYLGRLMRDEAELKIGNDRDC